MTTARPYRAAMSKADATAELRANAGTQFNPVVVEALIAAVQSQPTRVDEVSTTAVFAQALEAVRVRVSA
jgi:HD-GYP domain-containing protein (c-di-GMP phosphodiesterase class II)